jgi:hypothetical protein
LVANWTDLAKKYGHPIGKKDVDHTVFRHTDKSGVTPVATESRKRRTRAAEARWEFEDKLERYQKYSFFGFTAPELHLMEYLAVLKSDKVGMELNNPSHPVFSKERWRSWISLFPY